MLPSLSCEAAIYSWARLGRGEPCVDDKAGAAIELMGLRSQVDVVDGIKQGGSRDLSSLWTASAGTTQGIGCH